MRDGCPVASRRLHDLFAERWTVGDLVRFHAAHKLLLLSHSTDAYRQLGRLVAGARRMQRREIEERYAEGFLRALERRPTRQRHTNVLQHMAGYFKDRLDPAAKRELAGAIERYRLDRVPLVVPLRLIRHYVAVLEIAYLAGQVYLSASFDEASRGVRLTASAEGPAPGRDTRTRRASP